MRPLREEIRKKGFEAVKGGEEVRPILPLSSHSPPRSLVRRVQDQRLIRVFSLGWVVLRIDFCASTSETGGFF